MNAGKLVIGLVGMPGAGKSLVVEASKEKGFAVVTMGDVIREETRNRGLDPNPKNIGIIMLDLRKTNGAGVIAEKCVPRIEQVQSSKLIIDGLRSLNEAEVFKARFAGFKLLAVHASPETRFTRLKGRGRSDDPNTWEIFHERDMRELGVGLGNAVAMADFVVVNEGEKKELKNRVTDLLSKVETKWQK